MDDQLGLEGFKMDCFSLFHGDFMMLLNQSWKNQGNVRISL